MLARGQLYCAFQPIVDLTSGVVFGHEALLRARRRKARGWDESTAEHYKRHRWRVEGAHGEAKTQHGLRRAVRRGTQEVAIQVFLTAAVMNLKRLARKTPRLVGPLNRQLKAFLKTLELATQNEVIKRILQAAIA